MKVKVLEVSTVHDKITRLTLEHVHDIGRDVHANPPLGFNGRRPDVRRAVKVFHLKQRMARVHRLLFEHIKGSRGERTGLKCLNNGLLVDDATTGAVDDVAAASGAVSSNVWHGSKPLGVDQMVGFIGQVAVNGNVRAVGKEGVHGFVEARALCLGNFWREVRVVGVNLHADGLRNTADRLSDTAKPDEAEGFTGQF